MLEPRLLKVVIAGSVIFLVGILLNTFLLLASTTSDKKKRHSRTAWVYVRNLAFADILCLIAAAGKLID